MQPDVVERSAWLKDIANHCQLPLKTEDTEEDTSSWKWIDHVGQTLYLESLILFPAGGASIRFWAPQLRTELSCCDSGWAGWASLSYGLSRCNHECLQCISLVVSHLLMYHLPKPMLSKSRVDPREWITRGGILKKPSCDYLHSCKANVQLSWE